MYLVFLSKHIVIHRVDILQACRGVKGLWFPGRKVPTKAQHGGAHSNVLIKNPAKAAGSSPRLTNGRAGLRAGERGAAVIGGDREHESRVLPPPEAARINRPELSPR